MSTPKNDPPITPLLLSSADAGRLLGVTADTLADWRAKGYGPPYVRVGEGIRGRVRYPADAVRAWADGLQRHASTAEYDAHPPRPRTRAPEPRQLDLRALVLGEGAGI